MHEFLSSFGIYVYQLLMLFTISFPLVRSFEYRVAYVTKWKFLWPGMLVTAAFFLAWDVFFARIGVWWFSDAYTLGFRIFGLPIEEWQFFFFVPFSCVFIYECVLYFLPKVPAWDKYSYPFTIAWAVFLLAVAVYNHDRWYTSVKLGSTGVAMLAYVYWYGRKHLGHFWIAYLFHLIPFLLVNGVLTYLPVVSYNNAENLGIRFSDVTGIAFLNIPIEDSQYSLMLLLMNVGFYEFFRQRAKTLVPEPQLKEQV